MIGVNRWLMGIPALFFAAYQGVLALLAFSTYENALPVIVALVGYLACCFASVALYRGLRLPMPQTVANIFVAAMLPMLVNPQIDSFTGRTHNTWYVEAVAIILAITAVRDHRHLAYFGLTLLWFEVVAWAGFGAIFTSGLIGASLLVFAGTATSLGFGQLNGEIERLQQSERELVEQSVSRQVATAARFNLVTQNLRGALPFIEKIATGKALKANEKEQLRSVAESIRDGQAIGRLVDDALLAAISNCRSRGAEVQLVVGHQLDSEGPERLQLLRDRLITELDSVSFGRVIIRSFVYGNQRLHFIVTQPGNPRPLRSVRF